MINHKVNLKYIYNILIVLLLFCFIKGYSQQNYTLYNMNSISQSIYCNPSVFPINTINVGLPLLSSNYLSFSNSAFSYNDFIYKRNDDSLVFDMNKAIGKMKDSNYLLAQGQVDLLSVGFIIKKNYFNISIIDKYSGILNYSRNVFDFFWNGNGSDIGETINLNLGLQYSHYREYGVNYVRKITPNLTAGVKLKFLQGFENINTQSSDFALYTDPNDYSLFIQSNILINSSGVLKNTLDDYRFTKSALRFENTGTAFDFGARYKFNNKIEANFSLIDFGRIDWKENTKNYVTSNTGGKYKYSGLYIADVLNDTTSINKAFNMVLDSAYASLKIDTTYNSYSTKLNKQIFIGGTYHFNEDYQAGLLIHNTFIEGKSRMGFSASVGGRLGNWVHLGLSYSIFNKTYTNIGCGISLNSPGGTQFYLVTDNLNAYILPQKTKSVNIRFGMNLRFGKDPYSDDADGDGIPDIDDNCPDVRGSLFMKGCPDRDNDGIADFEDLCPDEYGLQKHQGCPYRDNDGVIDKFDLCPDEPGQARLKGCPDRDNDGVIDKEDECPDEPGSAETKGCPDSDGDGIIDRLDKCPDLFGTPENNGCPTDTDGDGVPDIDDMCPTVPGLKENKGCPDIDTDRDGLLDKEDECPLTPGTAANKGCPIPTENELKIVKAASDSIKFELGSTEVKSVSYIHLDKLYKMLESNPTMILKIAVYTDNSYSDSEALILTKDRANVLQSYFVKKRIDKDRLKMTPEGAQHNIADSNTKEGKDLNNRIVINITYQ